VASLKGVFLAPRGIAIDDLGKSGLSGWRRSLAVYADRRVLMILPLGFASGLPLLLTASTLSAWLATAGISRAAIGAFALVGTPYALKFLWAPVIDRLPPPLRFGRRRGWGIAIQIALITATLAMGSCDPRHDLTRMAALALIVAFLSASQDIVIDAYRVELLDPDQQGPGAAMIQAGYRIAMLASGAGALLIADRFGWFAAYATIAALLAVGTLVFLIGPEPKSGDEVEQGLRTGEGHGVQHWLATAVVAPFADFMQRPLWLAILIFIVGYKIGEAMAGVMAMPLYISLGYSLREIAAISKVFGFFATIVGAFIGGATTVRFGVMRALLICGALQSAGNLFYVLQAAGGHRLDYLALCVLAENLTGAMAGAALVAYLSGLCSPAFTATQYALLSSLAAVGRTLVASLGGVMATRYGWVDFFLLSTIATVPALLLLIWIAARSPGQSIGPSPASASANQ
jgi:MFS transporter, PAT family, beta-lactamase induction signal transducer AmpG